jgi:hypothetical protein
VTNDFPSSVDALVLLHRSCWMIGNTAFQVGDVLLWLVTGSNGENRIQAEGAPHAEVWYRAVEQAAAVGMLRRRRGRTRSVLESDNRSAREASLVVGPRVNIVA